MNRLTVREYIENRSDYLVNGRSTKGNAIQKAVRNREYNIKVKELFRENKDLTYNQAKIRAKEWLDTQDALHDPYQIAGGDSVNVSRVGDRKVNQSIGSQWKYRIGQVDRIIDELVRVTPFEELDKIFLNVKLKY